MTDNDADSPNHHIWLNRRTWWVAFTILLDGYRQERVRQSLGTRDVETARNRRDELLREYASRPRVTLSVRPGPQPQSRPIVRPNCEPCGC